MPRVLVVDDEVSIRRTLKDLLEMQDFEVIEAEDGGQASQLLKENSFDLVLSDINMPVRDGMELLAEISESQPGLPIIMLTAHATIEKAVEATRLGAYDFVQKPPSLQRLLVTIRNALARSDLEKDNRRMRSTIKSMKSSVPQLLGESEGMLRIKKMLERAAPSDARVLVTGEAGTGKELVARWVHELSTRAESPFVAVNCAAIPEELIESELFGHEKGSFTGASRQHIGTFEQADGGTLFLDEIGDMSLSAQAKVLRALQEGQIRRVGGDRLINVDVRVVAATNKDLQEGIASGWFREDLFHRLGVIQLHIPPLRERRDDIDTLVHAFSERIAERSGSARTVFTEGALERLRENTWSGNIRELHNAVERLLVLSVGAEITADDVELFVNSGPGKKDSLSSVIDSHQSISEFREAAEKAFVKRKLEENNWNVSRTAETMDLQRKNLHAKIKRYGLERKG